MKVVNILQDCKIQTGESFSKELKKDSFYIMSDAFHQKLQLLANNILGIEIPFLEIYNSYEGQNLTNKKVLALRHGGGGDILFMTTGLRELKRRVPSANFGIAISSQYIPIVLNESAIDEVYTLPLSLDIWNQYHYHLIFEGLIEENSDAQVFNAYDLFMKQMSLDITKVLPENKIPRITFLQGEKTTCKNKFSFLQSAKKKVGIQVAPSTPIRTYPPYKFLPVIAFLLEKNYDVYLFGAGPQTAEIDYLVGKFEKGVYKITEDLRTAITIVSFMDYIIAPDSMFIHIGGALRIPTIGLYGPFHSSLRMKYFENSIGIDAQTACSPCSLHGNNPCPKGDPSPCLLLITKEVLFQAFEELEKSEIKK